MSDSKQPNITLYTDATPNGIKISIALEELGLPYETKHVDISTNAQKEPWFLEINPNGRIPALTDTARDGQKIRLFEGGSILQYLAQEYDKDHKISFPIGSREHYEANNWLFWQHGGLGPMQGQSNHFFRYAPEKIKYGIDRYQNETRRLYRVLDTHLQQSKSGFIVGDHISIADITTIGWVMFAGWAGIDINEFPNLKKWEDMMSARPGVIKGGDVPKPLKIKKMMQQSPEEAEAYAKKSSAWIMQGMEEDKKK